MRIAPLFLALALGACGFASESAKGVAAHRSDGPASADGATAGADGTNAGASNGGAATTAPATTGAAATEPNAGGALAACPPVLACDAPALAFTPRGFTRPESSAIAALGAPHHRGRDLFVNPGEPQNVLGKFTYGVDDKDIHQEEIDVFVQRDCASTWEPLGTASTTDDGEHASVEGVDDNGGRIYFTIPADKALGPGRHRIRLVVAGDGTSTDSFIDVVPHGTPIFVSDVDGTLTSSETVIVSAVLTGTMPDTHPGAPEAFQALVAKGYRAMYLTARPEILTAETRNFLRARGFPDGIVHTSSNSLGEISSSDAAAFKTAELAILAQRGLTPIYGFGNMPSDSDAYTSIVDPQHRIFYQIDGSFVGRRIESYEDLVPEFTALAPVCD